MILDKAGELIADVMTANRSLSSIPSASAILDTSNYTFHAISYGKDAAGFKYHAHTLLSPSANGIIKVVSMEGATVSSYHSSAAGYYMQDTLGYNQKPWSPFPMDTRLEPSSTIPNYSNGVSDVGHCLNSIIVPSLSSYGHLIGCFPAASGTKYWIVSSADTPSSSVIISGTLSSTYNKFNLMDNLGFLKFAEVPASGHLNLWETSSFTSGVIRAPALSFPTEINLGWYLPSGDAGSLLLFGGIYHIGLWCLDLKAMLKQGYYPPYSFNTLNNIRKYRIFAKHTFNKDLLYLNNNKFKDLFELGTSWSGSLPAIVYYWKIKFI